VAVLGVVGFQREISAPAQGQNNTYYTFDSWSDGGAATHTVAFPDADTTLTANFVLGNGQCSAVGTNAFVGCYHANKTLSDLRLIRTDSQINFNWGAGAAGTGLPVDDFSVRWTGDFTFEAGEYDFTTATDDGERLYVDGVKVQEYWTEQSAVPHVSHLTLTAGVHRVVLEYFEAGGDASAKLSWVKTSGPPMPVVNCNQPNVGSFNSCFYYQKDLTDFKLNRTDNYPLDFDWGGGSPDPIVPVDNFSASFLGQFDFSASSYTFTVTGDDGVRLFVDGQLVLDKWIDQAPTTYTVVKSMTAGSHVIKLEYYEAGGGAVAKLSWVAGSVVPPAPTCGAVVEGVFTGCYYDNQDFTNLQVVRQDAYPLIFDWGGGSPDPKIGPDTFSARWQGDFTFAAGNYTFTVTGDDGVRLLVDGVVVLDKFIDQPPTTYTVTKTITAGVHRVTFEYYEAGGGAVAKLSWTLGGTPPPQISCTTPGIGAFTGCYYDNQDFTNLKLTRTDAYPINFNWGAGSPDAAIAPDSFSARWQGNFQFDAGDYTFTATGDDGIRLYVDGVVILDKLIDQPATTYTVTKTLAAGVHLVTYEYYEAGGDAVAKLAWTKTGSPPPPPPVTTCPTAGAIGAFTGCYFDNKDFTNFVFSRTDPEVNFNFGPGSPAPSMGPEEFSVRWTGNFDLAAGSYIFSATADDGVRLYVDGQLVIDKWIDEGATTYTASVPLVAGTHEIKLEYYENWGDAVVRLSWIKQ
jgi:hypothetical protein